MLFPLFFCVTPKKCLEAGHCTKFDEDGNAVSGSPVLLLPGLDPEYITVDHVPVCLDVLLLYDRYGGQEH